MASEPFVTIDPEKSSLKGSMEKDKGSMEKIRTGSKSTLNELAGSDAKPDDPDTTKESTTAPEPADVKVDILPSIISTTEKKAFVEHDSKILSSTDQPDSWKEILFDVMESNIMQTTILGLNTLDLIICLISLSSAGWDTAEPALLNGEKYAVASLSTNIPFWTHFRTTLFSLSVVLRSFAIPVWRSTKAFVRPDPSKTIKYTSWGFSTLAWIDSAVILLAFILKFVLSSRDVLVANFIILIRFTRFWHVLVGYLDELNHQSRLEKVELKNSYDRMFTREIKKAKRLSTRLHLAQTKLCLLMGEDDLGKLGLGDDDDDEPTPGVSPILSSISPIQNV